MNKYAHWFQKSFSSLSVSFQGSHSAISGAYFAKLGQAAFKDIEKLEEKLRAQAVLPNGFIERAQFLQTLHYKAEEIVLNQILQTEIDKRASHSQYVTPDKGGQDA